MPQINPMSWITIFLIFATIFVLTLNSVSSFNITTLTNNAIINNENTINW